MITLGKRPRNTSTSTVPGKAARSGGDHPSGPRSVPSRPPSNTGRFSTSLFNIPIQGKSSHISQPSNNTASIPILVRPWKDSAEKDYKPGSILFVSRDATSLIQKVADLPKMNQILKDRGAEALAVVADNLNAESRNKGYNYFGIYRNENNLNSSSGRGTQQQLINCDIYGRTKISNIFSDSLVTGDHVGIGLFRCKDSDDSDFYKLLPTVNQALPDELKRGPYSSVVDPHEYSLVSIEDLRPGGANADPAMLEEAEKERLCAHFPIGIVSNTVCKRGSMFSRIGALEKRGLLTTLPQIEVLIL